MSNEVTPYGAGDSDDGFHGPSSGRMTGRNYVKWNDNNSWLDRDGLPPPKPLLVVAIDEALQKWKDNKPELIRDKPLPDVDELNATIPQSEWETGIDNKPRPPWARIVIVILVNPTTAEIYNYSSPTTGARMAYDQLNEQVFTMRALRGIRVMPVVVLSEKPFKTAFGMRKRPHFEIIGWKTPGGDDGKAIPPKPDMPQLSAPTVAAPEPAPKPEPSPTPNQPQPKTADETLAAMSDVKPVTVGEVIDDVIPW